jgi:IS4 transposase
MKVIFYGFFVFQLFVEMCLLLIFEELISNHKRVISFQLYYLTDALSVLQVSKTFHSKAAHLLQSFHIDLFLYVTQSAGKERDIRIDREGFS